MPLPNLIVKKRFEYRRNSLHLANGIIFFLTGILYVSSKGFLNWEPYIWCIGALLWTHSYLSYRKHGLLQIDNTQIQFNHANWKGIQTVMQTDIENIEFLTKTFLIKLKSGKKVKIHKSALTKESIPILEDFLNSLRESNDSTTAA